MGGFFIVKVSAAWYCSRSEPSCSPITHSPSINAEDGRYCVNYRFCCVAPVGCLSQVDCYILQVRHSSNATSKVVGVVLKW